MRTIIAIVILSAAVTYAQNQACIVPSPTTPPQAKVAVITMPGDGGTTGCTFHASAPGATGPMQEYSIGNAKCATVVGMANQAVSNDNGWNDGGAP